MKNEALEVLKNRRSIRKFKSEQISDEELNIVLEAGLLAPSAAGTQTPVIVAVQDPESVKQLASMNAKILNMAQMSNPYYGAPTILLVLAPADAHAPVEDSSLVAGNLMNAAYAVGLGSCWIHRGREMFESEEGKSLLEKWNLPANMTGVATIALGYPDCPKPEAAPRKEGRLTKI